MRDPPPRISTSDADKPVAQYQRLSMVRPLRSAAKSRFFLPIYNLATQHCDPHPTASPNIVRFIIHIPDKTTAKVPGQKDVSDLAPTV
jgi:hypothetical protein